MAAPVLPSAVVFDCDGTLADTESLSDEAWREELSAHGYAPSEQDFRAVVGRPYEHNFAYFSRRVALGDPEAFRARVRGRFRTLLDERLSLHPDARDTVRALATDGVPLAVASTSARGHVEEVLRRGGITDLVAVVVGADDVRRLKPDPEPYLVAAARLGLPPAACVAVEDTPVGVTSAVAAGLFTVAVRRGAFTHAELAPAHRVVDRITPTGLAPGPAWSECQPRP